MALTILSMSCESALFVGWGTPAKGGVERARERARRSIVDVDVDVHAFLSHEYKIDEMNVLGRRSVVD